MTPTSRAARASLALIAVVAMVGVGCSGSGGSGGSDGSDAAGAGTSAPTTTPTTTPLPAGCEAGAPEALVPELVRTVAHDPTVYTQGLLLDDGVLYESGGLYGESELRAVDPATGEERHDVALPDGVFGEGLAVGRDGELVQITWKAGVAYRWDRTQLDRGDPSIEPIGEFEYDGEGWGLTTLDDGTLAMSDGSDTVTLRDPDDFSVVAAHTVGRVGGRADELNELEWDGTSLWANRYQTDEILRIDPECWTVTGVVDMAALRADAVRAAEQAGDEIDVTNGIAHERDTDRYLVTGKWWPRMYEVRFVPA